jgi:predicted ATPase/class 3 adenylate cyclase
MADLPSGVITMLFSDIEGSTLTLSRLGPRWGEALSAQRAILRSVFAAHDGIEMGTEGDSFFLVFTSARHAVLAAVDGQRRLQQHEWPDSVPIRVRMGLHTGEPQRHEDGYIGLDLHRAARIAGTSGGGQIVVSEATRLLAGALGEQVHVRDLGWHRLKDLSQAEHLFDLVVDGLVSDFPPLRSIGTLANLPTAPTPLVGRDGELAELRAKITDQQVRLLTLTGPGGTGKTRLAVGIAQALEHAFPAGIFFSDLSTADRAATMWLGIADALDAAGESEELPRERALRFLSDRSALLILDNLEQIVDADRVVGELLSAAPAVKVVATTRRPLHLVSEYEHPVPPLDLPARTVSDPAAAARAGAVELFVRRARMVRPSFQMTEANVAAVVELCRHLDGLPLAIELAAARSKLLSPQALLSRLDSTLGSGVVAADRAERQRTLASTIAWSYDLLTPAEQEVFRKLGVFASQCDLAAVEAVLDISGVDPLDAVAHLVDVSLVRIVDGADGEPRVLLLETIAAFARHQLERAGQAQETRLAHARWCSELAKEMSALTTGPRQMEALDRLAGVEEEVRQALDWCLRPIDEVGEERLQYGIALVRAMHPYWYRFGYAAEGRGWASRALEMAGRVDSADTLDVLHALGVLQIQQGDLDPAVQGLQRALEMARRLADGSREARQLNSLGIALRMRGDLDEARQHIELSASIARERGEEMRLSTALSNLPMIFMDAEQWPEALQAARDAVAVSSRLDDDWGFVTDEFNLSMALLYVEGPTAALAHLARLTPRAVALADAELNVSVVEMFAAIHAELGDARMAGQLLAASDKSRKTLGMPRAAPDDRLLERAFNSTGVRSTHEWTSGYEEGRTLGTDAAIARALAASESAEMVADSAE